MLPIVPLAYSSVRREDVAPTTHEHDLVSLNRRTFVKRTTLAMTIGASLDANRTFAAESPGSAAELPLVISTWPFGKPANDAAQSVLARGGSILDAVEQGIWVVESDPKNPSVGLGGLPDAAGVVQLDSCIMLGPGHKAGSVAAIEGIKHPISAARRVMEKTPHVMLVGEGARMFALEEGLEAVPGDSRERHDNWWRERARKKAVAGSSDSKKNHDTIALLVLNVDGTIAGGCSTSGWGGKLPGRVGDSPIIGSGLYVDNDVGAAGATGLGENVMRYCGSFLVVEFIRQGMDPQAACVAAIQRIAQQDPKGLDLSINFVALDKKGRFGAAGTGQGFEYSVAVPGNSRVLKSVGVSQKQVGPEGGNRR